MEESGMLSLVLDSIEDSPDTKRRRKNAEDSELSTTTLDAENRRLERELRQQEVKASRAVQEGTLRPIVMPTKKYRRKTENLCEQVLAVGATNFQIRANGIGLFHQTAFFLVITRIEAKTGL